jgi:hypothetical protein
MNRRHRSRLLAVAALIGLGGQAPALGDFIQSAGVHVCGPGCGHNVSTPGAADPDRPAVETRVVGITPGSGLPDGVVEAAGVQVSNIGSFGITINAGATLAGNAAAVAAFNRAAAQWVDRIADPITININADLANLGNPNVIGSTSTVLLQASYTTIRDAMVADALDEGLDDAIVAALPTAANFTAFLPVGFGLTGNIVAAKANLKALGFANLDGTFGANDATITFNSLFAFDFDNSDGVGAGLVDFETVAAHEIGHALGFISAVDTVDALLNNGQTGNISLEPLDLFRFQNDVAGRDPASVAEFGTFPRSLATGGDAITDEINAAELRMSTGFFTGDGRQASHWKDGDITGATLGVMDPTLGTQQVFTVGANDLRALDLIGYEFTAVPEPASLALLAVGLGVVTFARGRRRATARTRRGSR